MTTSVPQLVIEHDEDIDFLYLNTADGKHGALIAGPLSAEDYERARLFAAAPDLRDAASFAMTWLYQFANRNMNDDGEWALEIGQRLESALAKMETAV